MLAAARPILTLWNNAGIVVEGQQDEKQTNSHPSTPRSKERNFEAVAEKSCWPISVGHPAERHVRHVQIPGRNIMVKGGKVKRPPRPVPERQQPFDVTAGWQREPERRAKPDVRRY
jgi:hypothetical protein